MLRSARHRGVLGGFAARGREVRTEASRADRRTFSIPAASTTATTASKAISAGNSQSGWPISSRRKDVPRASEGSFQNARMMGVGSASPVVSRTIWSKRPFFSMRLWIASIPVSRTEQQMQPLSRSSHSSTRESSCATEMDFAASHSKSAGLPGLKKNGSDSHSMSLVSPNSLRMTAIRLPC